MESKDQPRDLKQLQKTLKEQDEQLRKLQIQIENFEALLAINQAAID